MGGGSGASRLRPLHGLQETGSHLSGRHCHFDSGIAEGFNLGLGGSLAPGDDGSCVTHSTAGGSGDAGDETGYWLAVCSLCVCVLCDECVCVCVCGECVCVCGECVCVCVVSECREGDSMGVLMCLCVC